MATDGLTPSGLGRLLLLPALAASDDVTVGLARDGVEIDALGYDRQPPASWRIVEGTASAMVTFGPMARAKFDEGLLFVAGVLAERMPFPGGLAEVADGMAFDYEATVTVDG